MPNDIFQGLFALMVGMAHLVATACHLICNPTRRDRTLTGTSLAIACCYLAAGASHIYPWVMSNWPVVAYS